MWADNRIDVQNEWFRLMAENIPFIISYVDSDGLYRYANKAWERFFNISAKHVLGRHIRDVADPKHFKQFEECMVRALAGEKVSFELAIPKENGATNYILTNYVPHFGDRKKVLGYFALTLDITERKQMEKQTAQAEERLVEALESIDGGFAIHDHEGNLAACNTTYEKIRQDILGPGADNRNLIDEIRSAAEKSAKAERNTAETDEWGFGSEEEPEQDANKLEYQLADGRWLLVVERPTPGGGRVSTFTYITDQKAREETRRKGEQRFRDFTAAAADRFWETNERHRYTYMSPPVGKLRIPTVEMIGHTPWDVTSRQCDPETKKRMQALHRAQKPFHNERFSWLDVDEKPIHVVISGVPVFDGAGKFKGYRGTIVDETDIVEARNEAQLLERKFLEALEHMGAGYNLWSKDFKLLGWNNAFARLRPEFKDFLTKGVHFSDFMMRIAMVQFPKWSEEKQRSWVAERLQEMIDEEYSEDVYTTNDGVSLKIWRRRLDDGSTIIYVSDVTEQMKHEEELRLNEEKFRGIFEHASTGMAIVGLDTRFVDVNAAFCKMLGYERNELIGLLVADVTHPDDVEMVAVTKDTPDEKRYLHKDGRTIWASLSRSVIRDADGNVIYGVGHIQDITERREAEEALRKSEQHNRVVVKALDEISDGIEIIEPDGHVLYRNARSVDLFPGKTKAISRGAPLEELVRAIVESGLVPISEDRDEFIRKRVELLKRSASSVTETQLTDGRWMMVRNFKTNDGSIILVRTDITELKNAQQEVLQSMKLASVGGLAAGIAHEINTPVQYIGDNLRFIQDSIGDVQEAIDTFQNACGAVGSGASVEDQINQVKNRLKELDLDYLLEELPSATEQSLNGVETISRIVLAMKEFAHPGQRDKAMADINKAIENTLTVSRNEWKHHAELETDFDENLAPVPCLVGEINQVLLNLVVNASHAIQDRHGDDLGLIKIATQQDGDFVEIRVSDNGTGIPKQAQDKVFDQFFTTKEVGKGTGQGLSVSYDVIVNKHGGALSFETEEGQGTTFIIRLPINATNQNSEAA